MHFRPHKAHGLSRSAPPPPPRRSWRRHLLHLFGRLLVFGVLLGGALFLYLFFFPWSSKVLDQRIQQRWLSATGLPLTYESATFRISRGRVEINQPRLLDPQNRQTLLDVRQIRITLPLGQFFFSKPPYTIRFIDIESSLTLPLLLQDERLVPGEAWSRLLTLAGEQIEKRRAGPSGATVRLQRLRLSTLSVLLSRAQAGRPQSLIQLNDARIDANFGGAETPAEIRIDGHLNGKEAQRNLHLTLRPNLARQFCDLKLSLDRLNTLKDLPWSLPFEFDTSGLDLSARVGRAAEGLWTCAGYSVLNDFNLSGAAAVPDSALGRADAHWSVRLDTAAGRLEITTASLASKLCTFQTSGSLALRPPYAYRLDLNPLQAQGPMIALIAETLGRSREIQRNEEASLLLRAGLVGRLSQPVPERVTGRIVLDGLSLDTADLPPMKNMHLEAEMTSQTLRVLSAQAVVEGMPMAFSGIIRGHPLRGEVQSADLKWKAGGDLVSIASILKGGAGQGGIEGLDLSGKVNGSGSIYVREPLAGSLVSALERTRLEGQIALSGVTVRHASLLEPVRGLKGEIEFIDNGRQARLKNGAGEWMGMGLKLSGTLRGKPLLWNQPALSLTGSADLDLARTRQRLAAAAPQLREELKAWPPLAGAAAVTLSLDAPLANWTAARYQGTLNLRDFATEIQSEFCSGPLKLSQLQLSVSPAQLVISRAEGRWGELELSTTADVTPAGGTVRLAARGELAEVKRRVPITFKLFRVGGAADAATSFTLRPRPGFSPPETWQALADLLRRQAPPASWAKWFAGRWVIGGGGLINARNLEMTYHAMPARLWGISGPLRFDMTHLWTPGPLPIKGGDHSRDCQGTIDFSYGTTLNDLLQGRPFGTARLNYTVQAGHVALDEWLRPWNFTSPPPGTPPRVMRNYDPAVPPLLKIYGALRLPSASYREVQLRDFRCQLDLDVTPGEYSNLFTWHDISGKIGEGGLSVSGRLVNHDVETNIAATMIELAPLIKGLTGREQVSGLLSGKLSGQMKIHQRLADPVNPPMEGSGRIRIVESRFLSNPVFRGVGDLLKLVPIFDKIYFSTIEGPFTIQNGQFVTKGIVFENPTILHLNAVGAYGPESRLNMELQLQLFPKAIAGLPLLGIPMELLNKAIGGVLKVNVRGTVDKPVVSLIP